jgi:integrase
MSVPTPDGETGDSLRTLREYSSRLRNISDRLDCPLTEATADAVNRLWDDMYSGTHPKVNEDGISKNTINAYQVAARRFFGYHDFGPEREDIAMIATEKNQLDEREVFDKSDIDAMREAIDNSRDRCIFELMVYTGQRIRAIQTLRIKDIDLENETFHLNPEAGGLKGAEGKRPLLGAVGAVREWLNYHPCPDDPEAHLITHRPDYKADSDGEQLSQRSINRALKRIAEKAGVDKPAHAHQFRHAFVTIAKRNYDMDDSTIKHLIGHQANSRVMETTYAHLTDEDHIKAAQIATGRREEGEEESPLSPDTCPTCDNPLPEKAKACSRCGTTFTPDAKSVEGQIDDAMYEGQKEADDDDVSETIDKLREEIRNNPKLKQALLEENTSS